MEGRFVPHFVDRSELILTQPEDSETFDFILTLFCSLSVLYQQFRVFLTPAFLPLILASPLGVSCVFAKETKTIDFAAGWVCLCFLHTVCSPARCYLKAVFKVTLGDFLDGTWTQHQMPPSHQQESYSHSNPSNYLKEQVSV